MAFFRFRHKPTMKDQAAAAQRKRTGRLVDRGPEMPRWYERLFRGTPKTYNHDQEEARRRRQIAKGMLRIT